MQGAWPVVKEMPAGPQLGRVAAVVRHRVVQSQESARKGPANTRCRLKAVAPESLGSFLAAIVKSMLFANAAGKGIAVAEESGWSGGENASSYLDPSALRQHSFSCQPARLSADRSN